jgi:hypothetical protein
MFPSRFEGWLDDDLPDLPLVKGSETHITPERLRGPRMNIQGGQRAFLAKAVDAYVGVLQRGDRTDSQLSNTEIVPAADEGAPF